MEKIQVGDYSIIETQKGVAILDGDKNIVQVDMADFEEGIRDFLWEQARKTALSDKLMEGI